MEAPEVPLETAQEHINEHAHGPEHGEGIPRARWILGVALSSAIFAALAAVASLMAGHHINEALIAQLQASDQWAYYQAKGIKAGTLTSKIDLLKALGKEPDKADVEKAAEYNKNQDEIKEKATDFEHERSHHIEHHEGLAKSVTMFQVCIAIAAIAVLTNRRQFWWASLLFSGVGVYFMIVGLFF